MKRIAQSAAAIAHLAAYSLFGPIVVTTLVLLASFGIGLAPFLIGFAFLALLALLFYGLPWIERHRVAALFGVEIPEHPMRRSMRADWLKPIMTLLIQFRDSNNWVGLAHGVIMNILAVVTIVLLGTLGTGIGLICSPFVTQHVEARQFLPGWVLVDELVLEQPVPVLIGLLVVAVALALLYGLALAHRAISLYMLVPSREAALEAEIHHESERRAQAMQASETERARLERDLHDGVQPRLVSIGMLLGLAKRNLDTNPDKARELIDSAHSSTKEAITELRQLARGLQPAVLTDRGLDAALSALAARSHVPVQLEVHGVGRYRREVETAVYYAISEALTNVAKHSKASRCVVRLEDRGGQLWARIEDNGQGGASIHDGGGLDGMQNRVRAAGGTLSISSPTGGPTTLEVSIPCA